MRRVVGVLVARPLESQGEEAAVGRSDVAIVVVGPGRTRLGGCLGVLPRPSLCADGKLLLDGLAGRAPGVDPAELVECADVRGRFLCRSRCSPRAREQARHVEVRRECGGRPGARARRGRWWWEPTRGIDGKRATRLRFLLVVTAVVNRPKRPELCGTRAEFSHCIPSFILQWNLQDSVCMVAIFAFRPQATA